MRKSICLLCLLIFAGCLVARADSLVVVNISGSYHNGDDTFSTTFSFDPAQLFFNPAPGFENDFLYPLQMQAEFPSPGSYDTVDFLGNALILSTTLSPQALFFIEFSTDPCQDIPNFANSGVTPTFTTKTCTVQSFQDDSGGTQTELVTGLDPVDFKVEGSATTPEPSSLILLGTGLAGLFQIGFRRMRAARRAS